MIVIKVFTISLYFILKEKKQNKASINGLEICCFVFFTVGIQNENV